MSKGNKFTAGFLMNYQCLRAFNRGWDKETCILFDWLLFRLHKQPELTEQISYRTLRNWLNINDKKIAQILSYFNSAGYTKTHYEKGKKLFISIDYEYCLHFLTYHAFDRNSENYQEVLSFYANLLPDI